MLHSRICCSAPASAGALDQTKLAVGTIVCATQGRFGSQQVDAEDLEDSEEGDGAFSEMVEGLLDDLLEKVDASLDRARAQLKAPSGKSADASAPAASGPANPGASQVAGARLSATSICTGVGS